MKVLIPVEAAHEPGIAVQVLQRTGLAAGMEVVLVASVDTYRPSGMPRRQAPEVESDGEERAPKETGGSAVLAMSQLQALLENAGITTRVDSCRGGVVERIVQIASAEELDVVALGCSEAGSMCSFSQGSVLDTILRQTPCAVILARPTRSRRGEITVRGDPSIDCATARIVLGFEGSEPARHAAEVLASLELEGRADIWALTVIPIDAPASRGAVTGDVTEWWSLARDKALKELSDVARSLRKATSGVAFRVLRSDAGVSDELLHASRFLEADLVVVGRTGTTGGGDSPLGNVARAVAERAPCSVFIVGSRPSTDTARLAADVMSSDDRPSISRRMKHSG